MCNYNSKLILVDYIKLEHLPGSRVHDAYHDAVRTVADCLPSLVLELHLEARATAIERLEPLTNLLGQSGGVLGLPLESLDSVNECLYVVAPSVSGGLRAIP